MAAPKTPRDLTGNTPKAAAIAAGDPATKLPQDNASLQAMVLQLQNTVNELITRFNAHTHSANGTPTTTLVTGTAQTATNLFTAS